MNSQEIIDYVMNTPNNTNPAILKQMIESSSGGSGGGYDLVIDHGDSERQPILTHGSYAAAVEKMEANIPPLVCVLRFRYTGDGRNAFGDYETVRGIGLMEDGHINIDVGGMNYYNIYPDNSVERVEE